MKKQTSLLILGGMAALLIACSCSRKIYVPVERVVSHRDSSRTAAIRTDTVVRADSVVIDRSGDTVYHTAWRLRERVSHHVDTLVRVVHDTLTRTQTVVREPGSASHAGFIDRLRHTLSAIPATIVVLLLTALIVKIIYRRVKRRDA